MSKRNLLLGIVLLAIAALMIPSAFAADDNNAPNNVWFEQMYAAKQANIDQAVKDGQLTPQQGQAWKQHFEQGQKLQSETGYFPGGGMGNCGPGAGAGQGGRCGNGSCRWNSQTQPQT